MNALLGTLILTFIVTCHEFGHLVEAKRNWLRVPEFNVGIPIPHVPGFSFRLKRFPFTRFRVNPFLFAGFIMFSPPSIERLKTKPYREVAMVYGAGVWANMIVGFSLFFVGDAVEAIQGKVYWWAPMICAGGLVLTYFGKTIFCRYLIPIIGTLILGMFIFSLRKVSIDSFGGPVTIIATAGSEVGIVATLERAGEISFSVGVLNMFPVFPLDGGRLISHLLKQGKVRTGYEMTSMACVLALIIATVAGDGHFIYTLFHK